MDVLVYAFNFFLMILSVVCEYSFAEKMLVLRFCMWVKRMFFVGSNLVLSKNLLVDVNGKMMAYA